MELSKKLAHAADKFNNSPRKKSYVALDQKSSSDEYETPSIDSRRDRKVSTSSSSPSLPHRQVQSLQQQGSSEPKKSKKKSKKRETPTTIEEDLASTGYDVSPKMVAVANVSKKHALRNELVMLNYLNALSEQLFAHEQTIQVLQVQLKDIQETQRRRDVQEAQRKLEEDAMRQQVTPRNALSRLFSGRHEDDDEQECILF